VIRKRLGRFATVLTTGVMALMLLGVGGAVAKTPTWTIDVVKLPTVVAAGNNAGYAATVRNIGPSNINALTLTVTPTSTPTATPTYFSGLTWSGSGPNDCTGTGTLVCNLGTVVAGTTITFTVAYAVPETQSGSFDVMFSLRAGTGDTGSDGGTSRGDSFNKTFSTGVASNQNFDGGFVVGDGTFADNQIVGRGNKQATSLTAPTNHIPVTIEDGITAGVNCTGTACDHLFGEWSKMNVSGGATFGTAFKVTLLVWGGAVPAGTQPADIQFVHVLDDGTTQVVDTTCTYDTAGAPTNAECITVTKVGSNFQIVAWLFKNGFGRGGI
jgi:hypothetical protein